MGSSGGSHAASTAKRARAAARELPDNGQSERGKDRELLQTNPLRRRLRVIIQIREVILGVVHVHDAEKRRERRALSVTVSRETEIQPLRELQALRVARPADELRELAGAISLGSRIIVATIELAHHARVGRPRRQVESN